MAAEHDDHKAAYDDINVRSIALVVGVGSVLIFVAIVAVQVIYYRYSQNEYVQKVENAPTTTVDAVLTAQRERLAVAGEGAVPENGEKSIPIEQAMKTVVAEYRQKQSAEKNAETETSESETSAAEGDVATEATATE
ncbi:MAG: hypothetical protein M3552_05300 [Planctomycetota bacterium]|nr:hypothetical protein [Planctomycetaceae bacterium]MDQ3330055.1 hypothetical protein [Planctomycetota bacterium]